MLKHYPFGLTPNPDLDEQFKEFKKILEKSSEKYTMVYNAARKIILSALSRAKERSLNSAEGVLANFIKHFGPEAKKIFGSTLRLSEVPSLEITAQIEAIKKPIIENALKRLFGNEIEQFVLDISSQTLRDIQNELITMEKKTFGSMILKGVRERQLSVLKESGNLLRTKLSEYTAIQRTRLVNQANDAFNEINRGLVNYFAKKADVEWYLYDGPLAEVNRDFCRERVGKVFHIDEIRKWADLEWKGKKKGTNSKTIFDFCGGYNCEHQLIPVPTGALTKTEIKEHNRQVRKDVKEIMDDLPPLH
jgi:hypothetical protein